MLSSFRTIFLFLCCWAVCIHGKKKEKTEGKTDENTIRESEKENFQRVIVVRALDETVGIFSIRDGNIPVQGLTGITYGQDLLYAVSEGNDENESQLYTIRFDLSSSPNVLASESLQDQEGRVDRIKPSGILYFQNELIIPHNDDRISVYETNGRKIFNMSSIPLEFEKEGDGLSSFTVSPNGEAIWESTLVGQKKDGPQFVRLMKISSGIEDFPQRAEFAYRLAADYIGPTPVPTSSPSEMPSESSQPSSRPSPLASESPSNLPSVTPTDAPSGVPSLSPSKSPTNAPSKLPSSTPSELASELPTLTPSEFPSTLPSASPTSSPSIPPSTTPSATPSLTIFANMQEATVVRVPSGKSGSNDREDKKKKKEKNKDRLLRGPSKQRDLQSRDFVWEGLNANAEKDLPRDGLIALLALDDFGDFLALERVDTQIDGYRKLDYKFQLFYVQTNNALDITGIELNEIRNKDKISVKKDLLLDFSELDLNGLPIPNFESMTMQPLDEEGKIRLIFVSNNEFLDDADTYLMTLDLEVKQQQIAMAVFETPETVELERAEAVDIPGMAESATVWINPENPAKSLLIATHGVGFTIFSLMGQALIDSIGSESMVEIGIPKIYADVDIIYAFPIAEDELVDVIVLADAGRGTIEFRRINQFSRRPEDLEDLTGIIELPNSIPRHVVAYTSPFTGEHYLFVGDETRNQILQMSIEATISFNPVINAQVVRTLDLPGQLHALTVDKELGYLYVSAGGPEFSGIYKFEAERAAATESNEPLIFIPTTEHGHTKDPFSSMDIYYAGENQGYLMASYSADSTFALFERASDNQYLGQFQVGKKDPNEMVQSDGISVLNVNLGPEFSCGIMIAQDSINSRHRIKVEDNRVYNLNTNFKIVKMEDIILQGWEKAVELDTHSWNPRRIAIAILVDKVAISVYNQMFNGNLSPRLVQNLIGHLDVASSEIYKPGTQMRKIILSGGSSMEGMRRGLQQSQYQFGKSSGIHSSDQLMDKNASSSKIRNRQMSGLKKMDLIESKSNEGISHVSRIPISTNEMEKSANLPHFTESINGSSIPSRFSDPDQIQSRNDNASFGGASNFQGSGAYWSDLEPIPRCSKDTYKGEIGSFAIAGDALKEFVWAVGDLIEDPAFNENPFEGASEGDSLREYVVREWMDRINGIIWQLPLDVSYF